MLYELLCGAPPFDPKALRSELLRQVLEAEPRPPSVRLHADPGEAARAAAARNVDGRRLAARLAGELDWIVMKSLEKDRSRRYDSVDAFAADLRAFLAGQPIMAAPPSRVYRIRKFVRRHRTAVLAVTLAVLGLVVGSILAIHGKLVAEKQRQIADDAARSERRQRRQAEAVSEMLERIVPLAAALANACIATNRRYAGVAAFEFLAKGLAESRGEEAPDTIGVEMHLARGYLESGRAAEASAKFAEMLPRVRRTTGPESAPVLGVLRMSAAALREAGRPSEAVALLMPVVDSLDDVTLARSPDHAALVSQLSAALAEDGRAADGESQARRLLEAALPAGNPKIVQLAQLAVARCLMAKGEPEAAEPLLRACRDARRAVDPTDLPSAIASSALGEALSALARFDEAEPLLLEGQERLANDIEKQPEFRPHLLDATRRLVRHFEARHRVAPGRNYDLQAEDFRAELPCPLPRPAPATPEPAPGGSGTQRH